MAFNVTSAKYFTLGPGEALLIDGVTNTIPSGKVWRIDSAGIGGTKGTIFLREDDAELTKVAILFSTIDNDDYSSPLPFTLPDTFTGSILNDSAYGASVCISECAIV